MWSGQRVANKRCLRSLNVSSLTWTEKGFGMAKVLRLESLMLGLVMPFRNLDLGSRNGWQRRGAVLECAGVNSK